MEFLRKILLETAKELSNNLPLGRSSPVLLRAHLKPITAPPTRFRNLCLPPAISAANCLSRGQSQNVSVALVNLEMFCVICYYLEGKQLLENKSFLTLSC